MVYYTFDDEFAFASLKIEQIVFCETKYTFFHHATDKTNKSLPHRTSFASWLMMNLLLMVVPRYGAYGMIFTGLCMLLTNLIYTALLPCEPLIAHIDGSILSFNLGWNYWLVLSAGS